ncbi:hypothetical protein NKG94_02585 [Micromonospora sp. M12]
MSSRKAVEHRSAGSAPTDAGPVDTDPIDTGEVAARTAAELA